MANGLPTLTSIVATPRGGTVDTGSLPSLDSLVGGGGQLPSVNDLVNAKPGPAAKTTTHRSVLGTIGHVFTQGASDLESAALNTPGAVVQVVKAIDAVNPLSPFHPGHAETKPIENVGLSYLDQLDAVKKHPLRNPGNTLLDVLPIFSGGTSAALRLSAGAKVLDAGEGASAVLRAVAKKPDLGPRILKIGDAEARGHYSRSAGSAVVQKTVDQALTKVAETSPRVENLLHKRAAKWNERNLRVAEATARAPGTRLSALGAKLKPDEQRALRLVAEQVPVGRRLGAQEMRAARATGPELARHQERIAVTKAAMAHLDEGPGGVPVFKPGATKLRKVYDSLVTASADRGEMLKNLDLMDETAQQAAKVKAAQVAAGGEYVKPTPGRLGKSAPLDSARAHVASLQNRFDKVYESERAGTTERAFSEPEARARLAELEREHMKALDTIAAGKYGPIVRAEVNARTANNLRATRRAAGVTKTGRASGAASYKSELLPTIKEERRRAVEQDVQRAIEKNPAHPTLKRWSDRVEEIDRLREALSPDIGEKVDRKALGTTAAHKPRSQRLERVGAALSVAKDELQRHQARVAARVEPTGIVGAEDIHVSPGAPFIGNPVERSRLSGKPKVSSTGTFGHTRKPGSLKASTGASVEHALERNDVTNIVAERHHEAVRLSSFQRRVELIKGAGSKVPTRKDDVFMWLDHTEKVRGKTVKHGVTSNERIPPEVRKYLDDPEGLRRLPEGEQHSIMEKLKAATFEKHSWATDDETLAKFEKLAEQGKGVFVPRRLLGDAGKRSPNIDAIPGVKLVDAVNNAQKAALVYLKVNYPIVQGLSNTAMGIIQQGFAYPVNVSRAVRLSHAIGPDLAAVAEDIMGEGAVLQAAFHGQGVIARGSQKLADVMTRKVDRPARLAAFLYEADKKGYKTADQVKQLLTDDTKANDLGEVAQKAKEAIVDYGELSPVERTLIRRILFVYPWQKGATKYAGQFIRDHPVQATAVGNLGQQGRAQQDASLGPVPSYLNGVFDAGGGLVNPSGVNFFQTPAQIGRAVAGLATGNPAASSGQDFLSPFPAALTALLTNRDNLGRPLKGNVVAKLRDTLVAQAPVSALARAAVAGRTGTAPDLLRSIVGSKATSQTFPDPNDAFWRFLFGGLYPRPYSRPALNKNAALEKTGR